MQYSVVNYKTVKENSDFRYEPEFWSLNYIEEENKLMRIKTSSLADCVIFSNGCAFDYITTVSNIQKRC